VKKICKELKISLLEHHKLAELLCQAHEIQHNGPDKARQLLLQVLQLHLLHLLHHLLGRQMSLAVCKNQWQQNYPLALGNE
jgi:hypothetical protein